MSIIGGIISYAALRHRDRSRARKTLVLGTVLFAALVAVVVAAAASTSGTGLHDAGGRTSPLTAAMTDSEIKGAAVEVPYGSLEDDPDGHIGTIIRYDGHVVQAEKQMFGNSYVLRIGTTSNEIGFTENDVWSEYTPRTDAEALWLDGLDREGLIMPGDNSAVSAWGEFRGLQEYDTLFGGKRTIPAVNVQILERGT